MSYAPLVEACTHVGTLIFSYPLITELDFLIDSDIKWQCFFKKTHYFFHKTIFAIKLKLKPQT